MNIIQENREKLKSLDASMIDCIKVGSYGKNTSAIYTYLSDGERLQVTRPVLNFMIRQSITKAFVDKNVEPMVKDKLTTIGGGLVCINMQNVQGFEIKRCNDMAHAIVNVEFKSGRKSFLYVISEDRMLDEQNFLNTKLNAKPEELQPEEF